MKIGITMNVHRLVQVVRKPFFVVTFDINTNDIFQYYKGHVAFFETGTYQIEQVSVYITGKGASNLSTGSAHVSFVLLRYYNLVFTAFRFTLESFHARDSIIDINIDKSVNIAMGTLAHDSNPAEE